MQPAIPVACKIWQNPLAYQHQKYTSFQGEAYRITFVGLLNMIFLYIFLFTLRNGEYSRYSCRKSRRHVSCLMLSIIHHPAAMRRIAKPQGLEAAFQAHYRKHSAALSCLGEMAALYGTRPPPPAEVLFNFLLCRVTHLGSPDDVNSDLSYRRSQQENVGR